MQNYNIWVLTLPSSKRYELLEEYLNKNNLKFQKVYGVDGKKEINDDFIKNENKIGFMGPFLTKNIIGCGLGHMKIWKIVSELENQDSINIVLEDDTYPVVNLITPDLISDIENALMNLEQQKDNFGLLQLTGGSFISKKKYDLNNGYNIVNSKIHLTLGSYIITPKSASRLLDKIKINYHIDFMLNLAKLNNYMLLPNVSVQNGWDNSTMSNNNKKVLSYCNDYLYYSLTMPILKIPYINLVINMGLVILFLCFIILILFNNDPILWLLFGFFLIEIITFDY